MANSKILDAIKQKELYDLCKFSQSTKLKLLYRGSDHGFRADAFHNRCDGFKKVIVIIRSDMKNIFGGFTSKGDYKNDDIYQW